MKTFDLKLDVKDIRTLITIIVIVVKMVILFYILEALVEFLATHRVACLPQAPGTSLDDGARILVPRAYDPSGLWQESRALGATISGMRHR